MTNSDFFFNHLWWYKFLFESFCGALTLAPVSSMSGKTRCAFNATMLFFDPWAVARRVCLIGKSTSENHPLLLLLRTPWTWKFVKKNPQNRNSNTYLIIFTICKVLPISHFRLIYPRLRKYRQTNMHSHRALIRQPCGFGVSAPLDKHGSKNIPVNNGWAAPRCRERGGELNSLFFSSSGPGPHYITGFCWADTWRTGLRKAWSVVAVQSLWCQPLKEMLLG